MDDCCEHISEDGTLLPEFQTQADEIAQIENAYWEQYAQDMEVAEREWVATQDQMVGCSEHDWQEQPGEPPVDICNQCGAVRT